MQSRFARNTSHFPRIAGLVSLLLSVLIVGSLLAVIPEAFVKQGQLDLGAFSDIWNLPGLWPMLADTALIIGVSTLVATFFGTLFAWLNERTDARIGLLTLAIPVVPLMLPPLAGALGWAFLAAPRVGLLNIWISSVAKFLNYDLGPSSYFNIYTIGGLSFVYVLYLIPHVYLTVAAALRNFDSSMEEASRMSGAGMWRTLAKVTVPAIRPAIAGGMLLALVFSVALYSIPAILGTPGRIEVLAMTIVRLMSYSYPPEFAQAVVLGFVLILVVGCGWLFQRYTTKASIHATIGGRHAEGSIIRLRTWRPCARILILSYLLLTTLLPFLALVLVSLEPFWSATINWSSLSLANYEDLFRRSTITSSIWNSVILGLIGATVGISLAAIITYFSQLNKRFWFAKWIDGIMKLPGALSHIIVALGVIAVFAGPPMSLHGTIVILLIAYVVIYMPQASISADSAFGIIGRELMESSLTSGATQWRGFWRIAMPLMLPGLLAGWVFLFVLMAGDVTASILLATTARPVVSFVMLDLYTGGSYPLIACLGTLMSITCTAVVLPVLIKMQNKRG